MLQSISSLGRKNISAVCVSGGCGCFCSLWMLTTVVDVLAGGRETTTLVSLVSKVG